MITKKSKYTSDSLNLLLKDRDISLLEYGGNVDARSKFLCLKTNCKHIWQSTAYSVVTKPKPTSCPKCMNKLPIREQDLVKTLIGRNLAFVKYCGTLGGKSDFICGICNYEWRAVTISVTGKQQCGCPRCSGNLKISKDEILKRLENRNISVIEFGESLIKKSKLLCNICSKIWITSMNTIINGKKTGCPTCNKGGVIPKTKEILDKELLEMKLPIKNLEYSGNTYTNSKWECIKCGHIWKTKADSITNQKSGCSKCKRNLKLSIDDINDRMNNIPIEIITIGKNTDAPFKLKCKKCNHTWNAPISNIIKSKNPTGCPICSTSGFKSSDPATFYLIEIISNGDYIKIGFGITGNVTHRIKLHKKNLRKKGYETKQIRLFHFKTGSNALNLENLVKCNYQLDGIDVEGFKEECLNAIYENEIIMLVNKHHNEFAEHF